MSNSQKKLVDKLLETSKYITGSSTLVFPSKNIIRMIKISLIFKNEK